MTVNRDREQVCAQVGTLDLDYATVAYAIEQLEDFRNRYGKDARIEHTEHECGYYYAVTIKREETDEEYEKRIKRLEYLAARAEENEKHEFERLKQKFGK
jgi:predicted RNase H-like nuclease (RuvC/YqgF family)